MKQSFADDINAIIYKSRDMAIQLEQYQIDLDMVMLALTLVEESTARQLLLDLGCDLDVLAESIEKELIPSDQRKDGSIPMTRLAEKVIKCTLMEAYDLGEEELFEVLQTDSRPADRPVRSEHMLLSMLRMEDEPLIKEMKRRWNIDHQRVKEAM
ncbi:MAG: Clp protease N-terminal domain-containing protein [Rhodothermales bacterium]